jgi:hypothetical protein
MARSLDLDELVEHAAESGRGGRPSTPVGPLPGSVARVVGKASAIS